jgi:hypothetical protein
MLSCLGCRQLCGRPKCKSALSNESASIIIKLVYFYLLCLVSSCMYINVFSSPILYSLSVSLPYVSDGLSLEALRFRRE